MKTQKLYKAEPDFPQASSSEYEQDLEDGTSLVQDHATADTATTPPHSAAPRSWTTPSYHAVVN